ncbi:MAG: discoidin domain-containing protein, partial [Planctomycetota bacterium]|nr:discoidin domain-containing protein [Planctomycetota bacterium]
MRKFALACIIAMLFSTTAMAIDIACSTATSWWPEGTAQQEMQEIAESVPVPVEIFTSTDGVALADWVAAHTGNGQSDLLILCGMFPDSIYPGGNAQPDGSLAELFLDDGNCIINTGDWMFYVGSVSNNAADGLANMMDIPGISMSDPIVDVTPTADGALYTPSFEGFSPSRPWHLEQVTGDWQVELILGQNADGTRADPAIVVNTVTGGRLGTFYQVADVLTDIRSVVISEWINNWYLPTVAAAQTATKPAPAGGATDVPRDVVLSWTAGPDAVTHDVYFGTSFADVNAASRSNPMDLLLSENQTGTTFDLPDILDFETTYYWRVDEVNGAPDYTVFKGDVWSFTAEPFAYPVANIVATSNGVSQGQGVPQNTVNSSGLNADDQHSTLSGGMWLAKPVEGESLWIQFEFDRLYKLHQMIVWNYNEQFEMILGFGLKDVTVEYSQDGVEWAVLGDVQLNQATASATYTANTAIDFEGVAAKFVRLTVNSAWGGMGQYGLSEVRFMYIPAQAREPQPADGAANVSVESTLAWRAGRDAVSHEVYLGADPEAIEPAATVAGTSYTPDALNLATTYYWQVNAVQETESWDGAVWSFATQDYLVVDDFESYTDDIDAGEAIFDTWL